MIEIECPYCSKEFNYYAGDDTPYTYYKVDCEHCGKEFEVETWYESVGYSDSRKLEGSGDE